MSEIRFSRQRESIIENLCSRKDHPTADMVYSDIRQIYPHVSLGTVYRNLSRLVDQGDIAKIPTKDGTVRYDFRTDPHDHFICRKCGMVLDLEIPSDTDRGLPSGSFAGEFDGVIEEREVTYYGICGKCSHHGAEDLSVE